MVASTVNRPRLGNRALASFGTSTKAHEPPSSESSGRNSRAVNREVVSLCVTADSICGKRSGKCIAGEQASVRILSLCTHSRTQSAV